MHEKQKRIILHWLKECEHQLRNLHTRQTAEGFYAAAAETEVMRRECAAAIRMVELMPADLYPH